MRTHGPNARRTRRQGKGGEGKGTRPPPHLTQGDACMHPQHCKTTTQICDFGLARGIHEPSKEKECDLAAADAAAPEKPKDML